MRIAMKTHKSGYFTFKKGGKNSYNMKPWYRLKISSPTIPTFIEKKVRKKKIS